MPSVRPVFPRRAARLLLRSGAAALLPLLAGWHLLTAERGILALRPGLPDRPGAVLAADFNLDGRIDLLQANFESSDVSLFQEDPSGNYVERSPSPFLAQAGPTFLASADLNSDNRPDAVVVNRIARTVTVLLSEVDLTFEAKPSIVAARGAQAVAIADYNRDNRLDLAITGEVDDTISIYVGRNDGTFGFARSVDVRDSAQKLGEKKAGAFGIVTGDFNGDARADLAVTQFCADSLAILLGNGTGAFQAPVVYPVGRHPTYAVATRLNDDRLPGPADDYSDLTVLLSGGQASDPLDCQKLTGPIDPGGIVPVRSVGDGTVVVGTPLPGGAADQPRQLAAGKIFQSAFDDVVVANLGSDSLSLYTADGSGGFLASPTVLGGGASTLRSPNAVALVDRDADGFPDRIAATNFDGNSLTLFDGGGASPFVEVSFSPVTATRAPAALASGFLDAGSSEDLAVLSTSGDALQTFSSLANAFFFKRRQSPFPAGSAPTAMALADFDRDFLIDVAVAVSDQDGSGGGATNAAVQILRGSGFATFGSVVGTCSGGTSAGASCTSDAFCPGGTCAFTLTLGVCQGGDNTGDSCSADPDCPSGTCLLPETATPLAAPASSVLALDLNLLDADLDGVVNSADNCPSRYNPAQTNTRGKTCLGGTNNSQPCAVSGDCPGGICVETAPRGDDCDGSADPDGDLVTDVDDNCLDIYNPSQADADSNDVGTACDHDPDLVALEPASSQIEILIRQVEGGFLAAPTVPLGSMPGEVVDGQFTAPDGHPDLAVTLPGAGSVQVLSGDGTGGFNPLVPIIIGGTPTAVAVLDINPKDQDLDGVLDTLDNCPTRANPGQQDTDRDGAGDACSVIENPDSDITVTFLATRLDNCPDVYNFVQIDIDQDRIGDACDSNPSIYNPADDEDADGVPNPTDNCPTRYNPGQENFNTDLVGNACAQPTDPDLDLILTATLTRDNCPDTYNLGQEDTDTNGVGDACDDLGDLAVADTSGNLVRLAIQFPPGSWVLASPLSVGAGPSSVAAVDLNGDSVRDLVVANTAASTLSVLLGNGDGTFLQDPDFEVPALPGPRSLRGGFFRRDAVLEFGEVAGLSPSMNTPMIAVNILSERADIDGSGRVGGRDLAFWAQGFGFSRTDPGYPASRVADINLDGKIDGLDLVFITSQYGKEMPPP